MRKKGTRTRREERIETKKAEGMKAQSMNERKQT